MRSRSSSTMYSTPLMLTRCRLRSDTVPGPILSQQPMTSPGPYEPPYSTPVLWWKVLPGQG